MLNVKNRTLFTHDNLAVMRGINSETIDLIYLDPPFNSKRNYAAPIGSQAAGAAFSDTWTLDDIKKEWAETLETENKALWGAITAAGLIHGESMQAYLTYMAIRLIEMKRILKATGSIYLHCDPTASHYLKLVMDSLFGKNNFSNEITWKRTPAHNDSAVYGNVHDIILYYSISDSFTHNEQHQPYSDEYLKRYKHTEENGRRFLDRDLTAGSLSGGGYEYEWNGITKIWRCPFSTMQEYHEAGRLYYTRYGTPRLKQFLDEMPGIPLQDVWVDIPPVNSQANERVNYPTQKPLKLLERIIKASSNEDDMVLDPFCGCATTCIAAESVNRQWIGIDIEEKARDLVIERLHKEIYNDALLKGSTLPPVHHHKSPPRRTETDAPRRSANIKQILYQRQDGRCAAPCFDGEVGRALDIDIFEVDHISPRSKGGSDVDSNLQLLCPPCNRKKGNKTMTHLMDLLAGG